MTTHLKFSRFRPTNQDAEEFRVIRYDIDAATQEYLGPDGEWHAFAPFAEVPAFCVLDGLEVSKAFGASGLRSKDWEKSWDVPEAAEETDGK